MCTALSSSKAPVYRLRPVSIFVIGRISNLYNAGPVTKNMMGRARKYQKAGGPTALVWKMRKSWEEDIAQQWDDMG